MNYEFASLSKVLQRLLLLVALCIGIQSKASHLFGGEFYYTHVSGNNYKFTLNLYTDCSTPNQQLLSNLYNSQPQVIRYNGANKVDSFVLSFTADADVTPVCPNVVSTCASLNGTQQGVRRYTYEAVFAVNTTSANWRFLFNGDLNYNNNLTGRSSSLTNIIQSSNGSIMMLEATLNNTTAPNSNASYNTIPTPFFCINTASSYNQGAVDPDGDLLSFSLVPGLEAPNTTVTYLFPFSATSPIAAAAGSFSFSNVTGQLSFTPNQVQNSVVVTKVVETRNGVVVGTSMREMVFVVLNNCNNSPPGGSISSTNVGSIDSSVNIYICQSAPVLNFTIPPTDINGDSITATVFGLPGNATMSIIGNGTTSPILQGSWAPVGGFVIGDYTFYVTYQDNGCPLKAQQTIAYTIHVLPAPTIVASVVHASCTNGLVGSITATVNSGNPSYTYSIGGATQTSNIFNNVPPGTYTLGMVDAKNCTATTNVTITQPPLPVISSVTKTNATCSPGCDATMTITATYVGGGTLQYSSNNGVTYQTGNVFTNLCVGTYTVVVKEAASGCTKSTIVNITLPPIPQITNVSATTASCNPGCDATISSIAVVPNTAYTFTLNGGSSTTTPQFNNVCIGTYTIIATDIAACTASTIVTIVNPPGPVFGAVNTLPASCSPGCDGAITSFVCTSVNGGLLYQLNGGTSQTGTNFSNLCAGSYTILATDASGCTKTTITQIIVQPNPIISSIATTQASCVPGCDATATINANAFNGATLSYQLNNLTPQASNNYNNLCVGTYTMTAIDSKNCTVTSTFSILQVPNPVVNNITATDITCFGANDGTINITVTGNGAITYVLQPSNITNSTGTFTALVQNSYTVVATDAKGCTISATALIKEPDVLKVTGVNKQDKTCEDKDNGSIELLYSGGTGPYSFRLEPKSLTQASNFFGTLADGTYSVTVTDVNGCSSFTVVTLLPPINPLRISTISNSVKCTGYGTDGWAEVTATAGNPPYFYAWNTQPPQYTPRIENLFAGTYIVVVTDNLGCTQKDTVELIDPTYCCEEIFVPNAFTPDRDGLNDNVTAITTTNITDYQFEVYDRWGNRVFSSTDIKQRWDGTYNGKEGADLSVYFYFVKYRCLINNKDYIKKGDLLLLR